MRKGIVLLLTGLLIGTLLLAGCTAASTSQADFKSNTLVMLTGGTAGTYYPLGLAMANTWNNHIENYKVNVHTSAASVENIQSLDQGKAQLAMAMNGVAQSARQGGTAEFPEALESFAAIGAIYPEVMQVVALKSAGIQTIEDLRGKRVSLGPIGSGTALYAVQILDACGLDPQKDLKVFSFDFAEANAKLVGGQLDAAFAVLAIPSENILDVSNSTGINLVDISGAGLERFLQAAPAFSSFSIPAGTYTGQAEAASTVSQWAVLYTLKSLDEDLVYNLTRSLYENSDETAGGHYCGSQISLDHALNGIAPVPLHPGAQKYYTEQGLAVD